MRALFYFSLIGICLSCLLPHSIQGQNYFAGTNAGHSNTGYQNTFVGWSAGYSNTTSTDNTYLGYATGYSATGSANTFVGSRAGQYSTTGMYNTFLGYEAGLLNSTGRNNLNLGFLAGFSNKTGNFNVLLGAQAGYSNTSSSNCYIGIQTAYLATSGNNNVYIGNSSGYSTSSGSFNVFLGVESGYNNSSGYQNTFLGRSAGLNNKTGNFNTFLGYFAQPSTAALSNATALGHRAYVSASNSVVIGSISGINGATASAKVGIGLTAPAYQFQLSTNSAAKPGSSAWTIASDARLKDNIQEFTDGLDLVAKIHPIRFHYNGKAGMPADKEYVGIIAQEMQQLAPYTVGEFIYQNDAGAQEKYLDYDAGALTYMLVNAVKTLRIRDSLLQIELAAQKEEITLLKQLVYTRTHGELYPNAKLWQNTPNPASGATVIQYAVPAEAQKAAIVVYGINGQQLYAIDITPGDGRVTLQPKQLAQGAYTYHLIINGQSVASRKLVITR
ncbi:MAG: tail fiber domain-containing protein [Flavitalea sp.]